MPQKKNPDVFELIRGRAAGIFAHLQSLLVLQKGLALAYNRDLQEDKRPVFDAIAKSLLAMELLALVIPSIRWNRDKMNASVSEDGLYATDLAEYLVRKKMPFSEAHRVVGEIVCEAAERKIAVRQFSLKDLRRFSPLMSGDVFNLFDPVASVRAKKTYGSTHPVMVARELARWETRLR